MELVFQEKQLDYLGRVLDQTVTQELTAEVIVPDSCADADRVVDAFGTLLVRAEECTAGSASVSGEVQAGILFVTEDGRLERLETVIPFSARRGWEGEQSDCRLQCVCRLCSVDARLVHSRKLLVRVGVSCTLTVYAAFTRTLHDFPEPAPTLQLRAQAPAASSAARPRRKELFAQRGDRDPGVEAAGRAAAQMRLCAGYG